MAEVKVTTSTILDFLKDAVESKKMMNPNLWIDAAFKLNLLLGDEHSRLESLRKGVAEQKLALMKDQDKRSVAAVELEVHATEMYKNMKLQEHKCDRIEEFIRLAKIQARTAGNF